MHHWHNYYADPAILALEFLKGGRDHLLYMRSQDTHP